MSDPQAPPSEAPLEPRRETPPEPELEHRRRLSLVWLVPLLAVLVGLGLVVRHWLSTGPDIVIEFHTAEGLEAGKTEVRYKEVPVGKLTHVALAPDHAHVLATVQLDKSAASMAVKDTRFWVVRPRIGTAGVSGLSTLLSGAYIGVDAGVSDERVKRFVGLETPPFVLRNEPGRDFVLSAADLGSLDIGSPVYYRRIRVGRVVGYQLDAGLDALTVQVFVEAPYERLVTTQSRFWNASGVDLSLTASGLTLDTQALASVIAGGVAFATAPGAPASAPQAAQGTRFTLFNNSASALAPADGPPVPVRMVFEHNTRGLAVGAPIDTLGVEIGKVTSLRLQPEPKNGHFRVQAEADLYLGRLGVHGLPGMPADDRELLKLLVERGMRAQLRNGNLLTGQMYVAFDFLQHDGGPATIDPTLARPMLPVVPSQFGNLQPQLLQIVKRISAIRFDEIGSDLQHTLRSASAAIDQLTPEARHALADVQKTLQQATHTLDSAQQSLQSLDRNITGDEAPLQRNAQQTLDELQRAARALRVLSDYLQRHPEALLRGQRADLPLTEPYAKP